MFPTDPVYPHLHGGLRFAFRKALEFLTRFELDQLLEDATAPGDRLFVLEASLDWRKHSSLVGANPVLRKEFLGVIQKVADDLYQIGECVDGRHGHEAVRFYVLINDGRPMLIDCGSQLYRSESMKELDQVLDGSTPEYVFLTHSELPHSGNLESIACNWPHIHVIVSSILLPYIEIAPVLPLDQIDTVPPGTTLQIAGREVSFLDALLKDQPGSQWIYDPKTGTLFTGDGFGYYHPAEVCEQFSDEVEGGIREQWFSTYHRDAFKFLRWVTPEKLNEVLDDLFQRRDVKIVAPIHGNAIRHDIPEHVDRLKQAVTSICMQYRKEGLHLR